MTIVKNESQFEVRDDLGTERLGDELLVLDKKNEKIHRLNRTATMVWEGLVAGQQPSQIASQLTDVFDTTLEVALHDVDRATQSLVSLNLLRFMPTPQATEE
jgi:hypothetical protein